MAENKRTLVRGKVAAIVTPTTLVVNRGVRDGVKVGMKFGIFFTVGPIVDPEDPSNTISELQFRKGTVSVSQVFDRMAYCAITPVFIPTPNRMSDILSSTNVWLNMTTSSSEPRYPDVELPMYQTNDRVIRVGDIAEEIRDASKQEDGEGKAAPTPTTGPR